MIIYKITNLINNKIYIGLTKTSLKLRWQRHYGDAKRCKTRLLQLAIRKYGQENFKIEEIDRANSLEELSKLEKFYIKKYNSQDWNIGYNMTSGGDGVQGSSNPSSKLTDEDVVCIRKLYQNCEYICSECYSLFKHKISRSAFNKVWWGQTWINIMPEVYTEENKAWHIHNKWAHNKTSFL